MIYFTLFTLNQVELEIDLKKKDWKTGLLYDSF